MTKRELATFTDKNWEDILKLFKSLVVHYNSSKEIGELVNMDRLTVDKILSGQKPSRFNQLRIEEWTKKELNKNS